MGLWDKVAEHTGDTDIVNQLEKKKQEMAKKMAGFHKEHKDVGRSGQRHEFDYRFRSLGGATRFSKGHQPKK